MFPKFNNVDNNELFRLSRKFNIEWTQVNRNNKNSIILYGKNKNNIFCLKQIPLGNEDLEKMERKNIKKNENVAWMELHILEILGKRHHEFQSKNFIHVYTKFVKLIEKKPYLCILFDNIPFTLYDMIHLYPYQLQDTISFLIQLYFVARYMNYENILHNDLHYFNVLVDVPLHPQDLEFFDKDTQITYILPNQDKIYYVIDYGVAEINYTTSNFYEWRKFFSYFQGRLPFPFCFSTLTSYSHWFHEILKLNKLKRKKNR
jgi:hypothetical protein